VGLVDSIEPAAVVIDTITTQARAALDRYRRAS
jgi:hypothetical protein